MKVHEEIEGLAVLIRDLRKFKGLTLGELAQRIGRSVGFLSQVERGVSRPTVADLTAISEELGVSTAYFYKLDKPRELDWVTRPHERRTLHLAGGITDVLASPTITGAFSMLDSHLQPGASSGEEYLDDSSEQGCFVLEGELTVWLDGGEPVTLRASDSFQLQPHASFRYANLTDKPTRVLWVFS
ncbi:TPA: XRE family transcriptional regulator [Pseudomonas putida]|jgi:transcriptional regulator with XRE-family HTH domain|uniref:Transcriptional regulator, XRE family n=1 Tax=Pseudomonas putida (strain GB-1) TaxID=76869 RepID=B0KIB5_PSEPG|nr:MULTISPECIES: XRE family transcriptional regulator [Pseudomonas]ABY97691.1 transcriptional regulator, XRE family [Pseudomonas putida GB-1]APE98075.1 Cro/Cl family transcriptional regulator [Pseudomonas putida]MBP0710753.1 helix-turn-helix transcriptional regulator [Pseudomonas sp. T34]MCE1003704.1 XRE family transcriptional regulator [Pseudomonas sp. NMI1173_11]MCK2190200.1 XRE family transcriptional regulator [Pseudomonas sp. MB04B]